MDDDSWEIRLGIPHDNLKPGWQKIAAAELSAEMLRMARPPEPIENFADDSIMRATGPLDLGIERAPGAGATNQFEMFFENFQALPEPKHIGFTGTREGMTMNQVEAMAHILSNMESPMLVFHHGDCVGADEIAHNLCLELGIPSEVHPPTNDTLRAHCQNALTVHKPKPYLPRNRDIVKASSLLIACPKAGLSRTGGTWYTIRYATDLIPVVVIFADGSTLETAP